MALRLSACAVANQGTADGLSFAIDRILRGAVTGEVQPVNHARTAIDGKPVLLVGYDDDGRAEISFDDPFVVRTDAYSNTHSVWVPPACITRCPENQK